MVLPASLVAFAPSAGDARNAVPAPGAEEHGVILSGSGATVRRVELAAGLWTVMMEVTENAETCGFSVPADFVVTIESGDAGAPLLANEIATRWSGSATLRVGKGLMDVAPGERRLDDHLSQRVRGSQVRQGPFGSGRRAEERKARDLGIRYGHPALATRPGLWTVSLEVRGNTDTTFGSAIPDDFVASIESADGGASLLANEIASRWSGEVVLRVGRDFLAVSPGIQILGVDASGTWRIEFRRERQAVVTVLGYRRGAQRCRGGFPVPAKVGGTDRASDSGRHDEGAPAGISSPGARMIEHNRHGVVAMDTARCGASRRRAVRG